MIILASTSDKLQVVTGQAVTVDVHVSFMDWNGTVTTPGRTNSKITTATTTDVLASPSSGVYRNAKSIQIANIHASSQVTVTLQHTDGTNVVQIESVTLLAGERFSYVEGMGFLLYDANGIAKAAASYRSFAAASIAAQGPGFASDTYVTGSAFNLTGRIQAGSFFKWFLCMTKSAGTAAPVVNVRTGTAGTTSDTARCAATFPTGTGVADTAVLEVIATLRAVGASAVLRAEMRLHHNLAATGFASTGPAAVAFVGVTSSSFDITPSGTLIGLSINAGTSADWTVNSCILEAFNLLN